MLFFLRLDFISLGTVTLIKRALNSSPIGSRLHIFLLRKVRKLLWLCERSFLWMVWQLAFLPWRFCWRTTQKKLSRLVLLSLLHCRGQEPLFKKYSGERVNRKNSTHTCNILCIKKVWRSCILVREKGVLNEVLYYEAPPRGPTYSFSYSILTWQKKYPFHVLSWPAGSMNKSPINETIFCHVHVVPNKLDAPVRNILIKALLNG